MTTHDLKRIANTAGFGTGKAARDRLAAEAQCRALLPTPDQMPAFVASAERPVGMMPFAHFGNGHDGRDWCLWHDWSDHQWHPFGDDAENDARIVAAILNAYRLGVLLKESAMREE